MKASAARCTALEDVEVECTHCGIKMTAHVGSGESVRYFRCGACHRWVSSVYPEVLKADAKLRARPRGVEPMRTAEFATVKERLERWLAALDDQDPYRTLGVSPLDSVEVIRERFHALALQNHPDRGGSVERMRELNLAYERIVQHREQRKREALAAGAAVAQQLPVRAS